MATLKLFGNNIPPACKYCAEAMQQVGDNILCMKRGIVPPEHSCRRFVYDPTKRIPSRPMPLEEYGEEDFRITDDFPENAEAESPNGPDLEQEPGVPVAATERNDEGGGLS